MQKSRQSKPSSQRLSALRFAASLNTATVRMTIPFVLAATLMTKYVIAKSTKLSTQQPSNLLTDPQPSLLLVSATTSNQKPLSLFTTQQQSSTQFPAKSSSRKPLNLRAIRPPRPDWAIAKSLPIPSRQLGKEYSEVAYNLTTSPDFSQSQELQRIVNDIVKLATAKGLPRKGLSITLIDANTGETAGYQQDIPRYPASVVKMFWLAVLYAQIENGIWNNEDDFTPYIAKMIKESDNEAASYIVDQITGTRSQSRLKSAKFQKLKNKRQQLNRFFQQAGYKHINISQKTFPLYYLNLSRPKGSELQMLGKTVWNSNKITTKHAARLMYEICYLKQAVSEQASQKMCKWLKRDLNPEAWQDPNLYSFNPVRGFFGQSLSKANVSFHSKAGWTSRSRTEAAMVSTEDNKSYILTIFAQNSAYANDGEIFPQISRLVYKRMIYRNTRL
ncbi:serine hydrolase [Fischerella sp. PCC 9605]|uniref:serine hydrolase n=1 Tax=Fischerella sp. PCC 9605 TaxID=1173024 RepID=UPI00047E9092|nr:serine hydrolase [Fischerella sp. PCC 9605]